MVFFPKVNTLEIIECKNSPNSDSLYLQDKCFIVFKTSL